MVRTMRMAIAAGAAALMVVVTAQPAAALTPRAGNWVEIAGEFSSVHFTVRDNRVRNLSVIVTVTCVNPDGSEVLPRPNYTLGYTAPAMRISRSGRAQADFRDGSDTRQFDVHVSIRFTDRRHARLRMSESSVSGSPACEGSDSFQHVTLRR